MTEENNQEVVQQETDAITSLHQLFEISVPQVEQIGVNLEEMTLSLEMSLVEPKGDVRTVDILEQVSGGKADVLIESLHNSLVEKEAAQEAQEASEEVVEDGEVPKED